MKHLFDVSADVCFVFVADIIDYVQMRMLRLRYECSELHFDT
jgi:hypothetical protein